MNPPSNPSTGHGRPGTVYALGRNYAKHAAEMGAPAEPVVFIKPASALLPGGGRVRMPEGSHEVHHEVELVLSVGAGGEDWSADEARDALAGVALGIDLTARDLQSVAKKKGTPWARAKGFPGSAPISAFIAWDALPCPFAEIDLALEVDGEPRQRSRAENMLLDPVATLVQLSRWFRLEAGDLVFTGTPEGVGPIEHGQTARASSEALGIELAVTLFER